MHAKDLMVPLRESLAPGMTLREAVTALRTARRDGEHVGVKGLPVVEGHLMVGFLSIGDILKAVFPAYLGLMSLGEFTWDGMVEHFAHKAAGRLVRDVMTREVVTVPAEAPLMECVERMLRHDVKRLPVVSGEGQVLGVLYERDLFNAIAGAMDEGRA